MIPTLQTPVLTGGEQAADWIAAHAPERPAAQLAAHLDGPAAATLAAALRRRLPHVLATSETVGTPEGRDVLRRPDVSVWCGHVDGAHTLIVRVSRVVTTPTDGPLALVRLG